MLNICKVCAGKKSVPTPTSLTLLGNKAVVLFKDSHAATAANLLQPCPTLCHTIDGSPPGSLISGILQARTLEWVAISFSNA